MIETNFKIEKSKYKKFQFDLTDSTRVISQTTSYSLKNIIDMHNELSEFLDTKNCDFCRLSRKTSFGAICSKHHQRVSLSANRDCFEEDPKRKLPDCIIDAVYFSPDYCAAEGNWNDLEGGIVDCDEFCKFHKEYGK